MSSKDVLKMMKDNAVTFVDFRFTDTRGKEQHVSVPHHQVDEDALEEGKMFDGSSISGWKGIDASDMILMPDSESAVLDPFTEEATLNIRCDVIEPDTMQGYDRDPRSIAKRAEAYMQSQKIADTAYFGPEPEFFVFDDVRWGTEIGSTLLPHRLRRSIMEHRQGLPGWQHRPSTRHQRRLLSSTTCRLTTRHSSRDVSGHGTNGSAG